MEELDDNTNSEAAKDTNVPLCKSKSKKRSLVERELETNLTERITSPIIIDDNIHTSRYGRARRLKTDTENNDTEKGIRSFKSPQKDRSQMKSPVYKMHASNSPIRKEALNKISENSLDEQTENIHDENSSLSRFGKDNKHLSPENQSPKLSVRKDLLQTKEKEEMVKLIKNYSPKVCKKSSTNSNNVLQRSCEKYTLNNNKQNAYVDNASVVKTLDFDGSKKKKKKDNKACMSKSDLFDLEAKCEFQVGDLAWAKMGTYPYWPCIVTRDPLSGMFIRRKLFGRMDRDVIHVTFFGDNGRRSWIVDNMLRKFLGQLEFEAAREKFTPEVKKKDPRCAAFFVSEKKLPQWTVSVEEAETLLREPKRLRIDLLNDMLNKARTLKTTPKESKKVTRTDSDVSLSESLYDTLFSEDDTKTNDSERSKKPRNMSLDVSEVVTACLDNMAAKTGITKIQKQSHMDRWLQKAKSKTPEKSQLKSQTNRYNSKRDSKRNKIKKIKKEHDHNMSFRYTMSDNESLNEFDSKLHAHQNEHDYSTHSSSDCISQSEESLVINTKVPGSGFGIISKVESLSDKSIGELSNDSQDDKVAIRDLCKVNKEIVVDSNDLYNESNGDSDLVINDVKTIKDHESSAIANTSTNGKCFNNSQEIFINFSENQLKMSETDDIVDKVNVNKTISSFISSNLNSTDIANLDNLEICKPIHKDNIKDVAVNYSKADQDTSSGELKPHMTNGLDNVKAIEEDFNTKLRNENMEQPLKIQELISEDQEKQEVNILNDKLVDNAVDSNKIEFKNDMNEISDDSFTMNVDSNLTIPEPNGQSNAIDDYDKVNNQVDIQGSVYNDKIYDASNNLVHNSGTDCSKNKISKNLDNKDFTFTLKSHLEGSVNNINSDVEYTGSTQDVNEFKADYLDDEYMMSDSATTKTNIVLTNGFAHEKVDSPENDSTMNCNVYLSSEDDRSATSTPTDTTEFSNINKYKTKFVKKNHKHITLQDALVCKDVDIGSDIIDKKRVSEKFVIGINDIDKNSCKSANSHEDMNALDERSQNTTVESERSSADSNYRLDSDSKSLYSETQTETMDNTDTMDVDESTIDSLSKQGYNRPTTTESESRSVCGSKVCVNLCEEQSIMSGDELRLTPRGLEVIKENCVPSDVDIDKNIVNNVQLDNYVDTESSISTDSEVSLSKTKMRWRVEKPSVLEKKTAANMEHPDFLKYVELKQDAIYDEHPELTQDEITTYLYNTWLYEESLKTDTKKSDDIESANMVKGLESEPVRQPKKARKRMKVDKEKDYDPIKGEQMVSKQKPKRRTVRPSYNEEYSDMEEDLEVFSIPKVKELNTEICSDDVNDKESSEAVELCAEEALDEIDEVEEYFVQLTEPKPNIFKGLLREKVCDICEKVGKLVKCKGCSSMFHVDCVTRETKVVEVQVPMKGRKKKKKFKGRRSKSDENGLDESHSDEKDASISEELANTSTDNVDPEPYLVANADDFEAQLASKMKELLGDNENAYNDEFSSDEELDWSDTEVGKCEVVDIKLRKKEDELVEYANFKCNNCQKYSVPICFVCRRAGSPKNNALHRQKCQVPHCNKYYHLECLEHWPQTQFNSGECARYNKKINEYFEALTCPRHVCHTCVSDDPRGCKTRFSGDKLARCVRCPATYHTFTRCLPAGTQILTGSHIICPRHHEHRPGKIPCHVNTGWCFICALGGTLICCEYCPTSFHAECLNIKPPEGGYMCEDCETGRLPLYGEMVWVKLGHYRWWPGIILHPCEIPENILAVKHSPGEFVVRFFGQYDHYWVNRGRVFPFQEGDSGKVSSQKSKIDAAFTMAVEHAQRACEILKTASPNEEESLDIASSLLPPHYVKLKVNKPCGALCGRRVDEESSLTQCECSPDDELPCGPYSHCLNRMLLTECGPTCRAGDRCNNRAFEKRLYPKLVPYRTPYRGWGLKTLEDIRAGQFVIEYVGELIDEEEFQRRMRRKHEIRDENFYFLTLDKERMIDAGPKGNLARFMNHCCEPNCETQKWTVLGDVRVGLFALYDIPANSEVTFNYNLESAGIEKKRCLCGAKRCSGYIGAKLKQTEQPKKPKRPYNKKARKIDDSPSTSKVKPKSKLGRPPKPKELTEIEKDLLIIKNATSSLSSDSECSIRLTSTDSIKDLKASKRKRVGLSIEESSSNSSSPSTKRMKFTEEKCSEICD